MLQTEELIIPEVSRHGLDGDTDSGLHFLINDTCYFSNLFIIRTWHFGTVSKSEIEDSGLKCSMIGLTTEYEYEDRKNVK